MRALLKEEPIASAEDQRLRENILNSLERNAVVDFPPDVRITVRSGTVYLEGMVSMQAEKQMIEDIILSTPGVRSFRNRLVIKPCRASAGA